ncbi:pentafunctional arom polypeptide [Gossypium australe]|uniref:Pentafunctional arom polypeptide n=1 Tax=Gossypium australe TaxID=47621 RepID=A0A5B6VS36_9ROSI|nr:pentafunctional arom polypeptide [Gossypium australe]
MIGPKTLRIVNTLIIKSAREILHSEHEDDKLTEDKAKPRLLELIEKLTELEQQRSKEDLDKVRELDPTFVKSMLPFWPYVKISITTKLIDLKNQVYDKNNNNKVEFKYFQGLEQALNNTARGKIPDYLESIAICIENVRRKKATEIFKIEIQILFCETKLPKRKFTNKLKRQA